MPKGTPVSSLKRTVRRLSGKKTTSRNPHGANSARYYKHIFVNKQKFDGIEVVAKCEHMSRMDAADLLLQKGLSRWQGDKLLEWRKTQKEADDNNLPPPQPTPFIRMMRRDIRASGIPLKKPLTELL